MATKTAKYRIENLDCAHCAANLEKKLNKGDIKAEINFATLTLTVKGEKIDEDLLKNDISKIESNVQIFPMIPASGRKANKYRINNLDCAHCAANLEKKLNESDFEAELNFATSTLTVYADELDENFLKSHISRIENGVTIHPLDRTEKSVKTHPEKNKKFSGKVIRISISLLIFITGLLLNHFKVMVSGIEAYVPLMLGGYFLIGYEVILRALKNIKTGNFFDETFLMTVASIGAIALGEIPEALAVMLFFGIGEYFENKALSKSRNLITSLLEIQPDLARVKNTKGNYVEEHPENVAVGKIIMVKAGEKIPLDGKIINGSSTLDTSVLTGESLPRDVNVGDEVMAGMINKLGVLEIEVTKLYTNSSVSKMVKLIENASNKKSKTEKFITSFSKKYTPAVLIIATFIALVMPLLTYMNFAEWIGRALVILVISCPCAFVISVPLGYFGGIGAASRKGILVKGSFVFDLVKKISKYVFDKTGTLTRGEFKLVEFKSFNKDFSDEKLLKYAASLEAHSNHPIAIGVSREYTGDLLDIKDVKEVPGRGIFGKIDGKKLGIGNLDMLQNFRVDTHNLKNEAGILHVIYDGKYIGYLKIEDTLRDDTYTTLKDLKNHGINKTVMLTGDNRKIAASIAEKAGIDEYRAELLPEEKFSELEKIQKNSAVSEKIAFVGDGINDAPSIARADLGIAMGLKGADLAIEASDVVLMSKNLSSLIDLYKISEDTTKIVWQNIAFAFITKALFITLGAFGIASMWGAVFADVGVTLIAILNSRRIIRKN